MIYIATVDGREYVIEVVDEHHIRIDGRLVEVDFRSVSGQPVYSLILDGRSYESFISPADEGWEVLLRGRQYPVRVEDEREKRLRAAAGGSVAEAGELQIKAPMPGLVVSVQVAEGADVEKGQVLVILESMKMQNELKSPRPGRVGRIRVRQGESVEQKQTLLTLH